MRYHKTVKRKRIRYQLSVCWWWSWCMLSYGYTMCRRTFLICYVQSEKLLCLWTDEHVHRNEIIAHNFVNFSSYFFFRRTPHIFGCVYKFNREYLFCLKSRARVCEIINYAPRAEVIRKMRIIKCFVARTVKWMCRWDMHRSIFHWHFPIKMINDATVCRYIYLF